MRSGRLLQAWGLIAWVAMASASAATTQASLTDSAAPVAAALQLSQFVHRSYTIRDGAPAVVSALAQTSDGFLWLGAPMGLTRFDGVAFDRSITARLPSTNIYTLYSDDGDLWIGYGLGGISRLRDGKLTDYPTVLPGGSVKNFVRRGDGVLWVAGTQGLMRLVHGRWVEVGKESGFVGQRVEWLARAGGTLWLMADDGAYALDPGATRFRPVERELARRARAGVPANAAWHLDSRDPDVSFSLVDSAGALWTAVNGGLGRFRWLPGQAEPKLDKMTTRQGLSSDEVSATLQDREGNVWIGTRGGLDQFRVSRFTPLALPGIAQPGIAPGEGRVLWVADTAASALRVDDAGVAAMPALARYPWCVISDRKGSVWMAGMTGLRRWSNGRITDIPLPAALAGADPDTLSGYFQALAPTPEGDLWLSVAKYGLYRLRAGVWTVQGGVSGLPPGPAIRVLTDDVGRTWFAYPRNRLAVLDHGRLTTYTATDGLAVGNLLAVDVRGDHVWVAGDLGVQHLEHGRFIPLKGEGGENFATVAGIVETPTGELWLDGNAGVYRVAADEVRRARQDPAHPVAFELFDQDDGLRGVAQQIRPGPTLRQGPSGRLWVARLEGVSWIDPAHIARNPWAPVARIESLHAASQPYPLATDLVLPKLTRNLHFDYTAPSLTLPQRVRFRYRLEGVDNDWQDAGTRREAFYTNLGPGDYRFRVQAANEDGLWSAHDAVYDFGIAPAFYQTSWFDVLSGCLALAGLWLLYLLRMRQLAARIRIRTAERERIARDLHDTLLQSIQGLQLRLQTWAADPSLETRRRNEMSDVAARTRDMLIDGRDRIVALRHAGMPQTDLLAGLQATGEEYASMYPARFHLHVEGEPRPLQPEVAAEILDIVREGLRNAFVHAGAALIELSVTWHRRALCILVCDDGSGIDEAILREGGRPGHWGLLGMRERAMRIGARLRLQRGGMGGTELYVEVPARRAYAGLRLWRRWRRRGATPA